MLTAFDAAVPGAWRAGKMGKSLTNAGFLYPSGSLAETIED
jgi:hypothetical protein